ncbi:uncharacterized protein A4U43_C03F10830 [Asparagus officinalis]|uniref:Cyclin N-terminal domain-containing protein n=2 Tax=Asparagus officinalis TaxID=4686 RepID=A0A5P1F8Y7_ASPOF|nr:uncharacterized protein A4U43_C03F10830 [Asparagus officinalis]
MASLRKSGFLSSSAAGTTKIDLNRGKGKVQGLENSMAKCEISVKSRAGRKALVDISNLKKSRSNQCGHELSNKPKIMKEKLVGSNLSQGKTTGIHRPRVSLTKSVVIASVLSKPVKENTKSSVRANGRNTHVECSMRRKAHIETSSCQGHRVNQPLDSSKPVKNQGVKLSRPRLSFATQRALDANILSRKPVGIKATSLQTNSKLRSTLMTKYKSNVEISITDNACVNEIAAEPNSFGPGDNELVSSQDGLSKAESDGKSCSIDTVKAIISKPKCKRRRSYTSSLVARSETPGNFSETSNFIGKDVNIDDNMNPLEVTEYVDDIYQYYWAMEVQNLLPANYMTIQSDITPRMRGILVNWLIEVHLKFQLMQETLFLMVQLLDRVLSVVPIKKDQLQMVGLVALLLASKYEDYWHPKINELISISANSYTRDQMLAMEKLVLRQLSFRLNLPTPYVFMLRFLKAAQSDKKLEHLAFYLIELCLGEYEALKYRPSLLCASAIYVARCSLQITPAWTGLLRKYARYEESQLRVCAEMILRFHKAACLKPTRITYDKYLSPDRSCVAALTAINELP